MKAKAKAIYDLILPSKKNNYFILLLFLIGFICGSFFITIINADNKTLVINQITNFMTNINNHSINNLSLLKNSFFSNIIYLIVVWLLGLSVLGAVFNIFFVYFKGFVFGFTISGILLSYKIKGLLFSLIYIFPNELIKILFVLILGVYSLTLSIDIIKEIFKIKNNNLRKIFKKYIFIFFIGLFLITITSLYESFVIPKFLNLIY